MNSELTPKQETNKHIVEVMKNCIELSKLLMLAGANHDKSKFSPEEWPTFEKETPLLKTLVYGSQEYTAALGRLTPALKHHYAVNRHHPEFFNDMNLKVNGVAAMTLVDLCEMFCDWIAASKRTKDGDPYKGIEISCKKFNMPPMLEQIFVNTVRLIETEEEM